MRSFAVVASLLLTAGGALADTLVTIPGTSAQQLRLLHEQQRLLLQREHDGFSARLPDRSLTQERALTRQLHGQILDQRQLHERQARQQRALRQQVQIYPGQRGADRLSLQLQGFKREQRAQRLRQSVQRRSWSPLSR